ncbi:MAG: YitT family protein, partial [Rhodoferax sp.]|nr:YitT family protein [Rhodoferax sp.]
MSCAPPSSDAVALAHGPAVAVAAAPAQHRAHEDVQALVSATLLVAFGVVLFGKSGLLTGGTAGLAFLLGYASGMDFGVAFFLVNLPFY